tara:strand:+ start:1061 stop:1237 length:177 start_codon:yes stop_codon:yes gene_type:complete
MKIYEIVSRDGDEPLYIKSKKELKDELQGLDKDTYWIEEHEFEYNLDSICTLCSMVSR